jgi:hypothetical protein
VSDFKNLNTTPKKSKLFSERNQGTQLKPGNFCCSSVYGVLSSHLLFRNAEIAMYKTIILSAVLSSHLLFRNAEITMYKTIILSAVLCGF